MEQHLYRKKPPDLAGGVISINLANKLLWNIHDAISRNSE